MATETAEIFRHIGIGMCLFLIGMQIAYARRSPQALWRWFIFGKILLIIYIGIDLQQQTGPMTWRLPLAFAAITISAVTLSYMVIRDRCPFIILSKKNSSLTTYQKPK